MSTTKYSDVIATYEVVSSTQKLVKKNTGNKKILGHQAQLKTIDE